MDGSSKRRDPHDMLAANKRVASPIHMSDSRTDTHVDATDLPPSNCGEDTLLRFR